MNEIENEQSVARVTHTRTHEYSSKGEKDWTGNKATTFAQLGASNHSQGEREVNDFYATHPLSLKIFLDKLNEDKIELHSDIWECACGMGHLSKVLEEKGYNVLSTDLIDRGYGTSGIDFLKAPNDWNGDILTNPPYKYAKEFVEKGLEAVTPRKICNYVFENTIFRGERKIQALQEIPSEICLCKFNEANLLHQRRNE